MKYCYIILSVVLISCSSTGVVTIGDDLYMIGQRSVQVGIGRPVGVIADVYKEASMFCEKEDKEVITVNLEVQDTHIGRPGSVDLQFKCE